MAQRSNLAGFGDLVRNGSIPQIKPILEKLKTGFVESYPASARGFDLSNDLTDLYDTTISAVMRRFTTDDFVYCCAATGGYGRRELNIHSDVDLVFLYSSAEFAATEKIKAEINACIRFLWDVGLKVGHSVRTPREYAALAQHDAEVKTSLLDLRWVAGDRTFFDGLEASIVREAFRNDARVFLTERLDILGKRHERHGGSDRILEPHIKEGAGGFRDLHAAFWVGKVWLWILGEEDRARLSKDCLQTFQQLVQAGYISSDYAVGQSMEFLMATRNALHEVSKRQQDVLTYALQDMVARLLGYADRDDRKGVEWFMRDYYRHARNIHQFLSLIRDKIRTAVESKPAEEPIVLKYGFHISRHKLYYDGQFPVDLDQNRSLMTKAFLFAQHYDVPMSEALLVDIRENVHRVDESFLADRAVAHDFLEIWKSEGKVAGTLEKMHACGFLERYLPEFGFVVAHYNYNVYHYYTTDEHLIVGVRCLESLFFDESDDSSAVSGHLRAIYDEMTLFERYQLYWAVFLHDIGKSRGGDHCEIGVALAKDIFARLRYFEDASAIYFLILNHLRMEQTAFRRNLKDEQTIREFAVLVGNRRWLRMLYLLTFADLSASNKSAWTEWKGTLLMELFSKTDQLLKAQTGTGSLFNIEEWEELDYAAVALNGPFDVEFTDHVDFSDVRVITTDVPYRLSQICGVMAAADASIFDANVHTRADGVIIDQFKVTDFTTQRALSSFQKEKIRTLLGQVLSGSADIQHEMVRLKQRWKRRKIRSDVETEVLFEDNRKYTIIDVFAPDRIGLLYLITRSLSEAGLNIFAAKIGTRLDGAADCFYVLDLQGSKIDSLTRQEEIRRFLLKRLEH